jgi:hypothetical protein
MPDAQEKSERRSKGSQILASSQNKFSSQLREGCPAKQMQAIKSQLRKVCGRPYGLSRVIATLRDMLNLDIAPLLV